MEDFDFTDDEIRDELEKLGYNNIPTPRLRDFKRDLEQLMRSERSQTSSSNTSVEGTYAAIAPMSHLSQPDRVPTQMYNDNRSLKSCLKTSSQSTSAQIQQYPLQQQHQLQQQQRAIKRKVLRKKSDGLVEVSEESITESESDDMANIEERLRHLPLSAINNVPSSSRTDQSTVRRPQTLTTGVSRQPSSARGPPDRPTSAPPERPCQTNRVTRPLSAYNLPDGYNGPKALICPMACEPHLRNIPKSDPVASYQRYRQCWQVRRVPGERAHKQLRWGIREQMLYCDEVVEKKPRSYCANTYVVPSDKKRKTLRWQIRNELAQGIKPVSIFD